MKMPRKLAVLMAVSCLIIELNIVNVMAYAGELVPAIQSGLYYKLGGGDDVPLPAFYDTSYIPLNADANVGLGFNCGAFNPVASLRHSLNQIRSSFLAVKQQVLRDATGAVTEFPLYELSRADPSLYNLITNAIAGAREDMSISTKSCEVMQSEIASGEDPYAHWGQISLGSRWKQEIGDALISGNGDINQARYSVSQDAGKSGVPWIDPNSLADFHGTQPHYAGGKNQPPIHVIHDSSMGGYKIIVDDSASRMNKKNFLGHSHSEITAVFPNAKAAADWITNVVGDETITTYDAGLKSSQPGMGLYADIQYETQQIVPKLQALVIGSTSLTVENLQALSLEGMALSPEMIRSIQDQPKVIQSIIVAKVSQNIAAMRVINKARLAIRILQSGSRIPAVYSNKTAGRNIQNSIQQLQRDVQDILMFVKARQTLMSNMLTTIVQAGASQQRKNTAISMPRKNAPNMQNGAIRNGK